MRVLKGAEAEVLDLAFSPDGRAIAAGFEYQPVYLWNLEAAASDPGPACRPMEDTRRAGCTSRPMAGRCAWWERSNAPDRTIATRGVHPIKSFAITRTSNHGGYRQR